MLDAFYVHFLLYTTVVFSYKYAFTFVPAESPSVLAIIAFAAQNLAGPADLLC